MTPFTRKNNLYLWIWQKSKKKSKPLAPKNKDVPTQTEANRSKYNVWTSWKWPILAERGAVYEKIAFKNCNLGFRHNTFPLLPSPSNRLILLFRRRDIACLVIQYMYFLVKYHLKLYRLVQPCLPPELINKNKEINNQMVTWPSAVPYPSYYKCNTIILFTITHGAASELRRSRAFSAQSQQSSWKDKSVSCRTFSKSTLSLSFFVFVYHLFWKL